MQTIESGITIRSVDLFDRYKTEAAYSGEALSAVIDYFCVRLRAHRDCGRRWRIHQHRQKTSVPTTIVEQFFAGELFREL
jgi:hypothetical protein